MTERSGNEASTATRQRSAGAIAVALVMLVLGSALLLPAPVIVGGWLALQGSD